MLTPRLKQVSDYVMEGSIVGDVGSDHGYVVVDLVRKGIIERAIASDLNKGPVENAKRNIEKYNLTEAIETRLGGGLKPYLAGEINTAIIAGMGGILISDILEESKALCQSIEYFILQPMNFQDHLRKYLQENGFEVVDESIVKEGEKFYQVLLYKRGKMVNHTAMELVYGKKMLKDSKVTNEFVKAEIKKIETIKKNLKNSDSDASKERLETLDERTVFLKGYMDASK